MSRTPVAPRQPDAAVSLRDLAGADVISQIEGHLSRLGELGLLSVSVLRQQTEDLDDRWEHYEKILEEISVCLIAFSRQRLRRSDRLFDPMLAGNTFVLLLSPPRDGRPLDSVDILSVRRRLLRSVDRHLTRTVPRSIAERYGVFVGGSRLCDQPNVDAQRIIHRGLEEAMADALGQRERHQRRRTLSLQRILRGERVRTVYQPVVDLVDRRVIGFEALTRTSQRQFHTPELLFRTAEEHGALWTLERLCRRRALEHLPSLDGEQLLFLNIEPGSIHDPQLRDSHFAKQLERARLDPTRVVLELTEHAAVRDFPSLRRVVQKIRSLGFRLALDDVGSGYAGLQTVAEIRPDFLKVDMTLVRNVDQDVFKRELIATIRQFSETTGTVLVAEGVESTAEMSSLSEVGVRCAQGYLFAEPDSPPKTPDWKDLLRLS